MLARTQSNRPLDITAVGDNHREQIIGCSHVLALCIHSQTNSKEKPTESLVGEADVVLHNYLKLETTKVAVSGKVNKQ